MMVTGKTDSVVGTSSSKCDKSSERDTGMLTQIFPE